MRVFWLYLKYILTEFMNDREMSLQTRHFMSGKFGKLAELGRVKGARNRENHYCSPDHEITVKSLLLTVIP